MPTLRQYRRRFARHVGLGLVAGTATGGAGSYLADSTRTTSLPIGDDRAEWWLLRPDATNVGDRLRLVHHVELNLGHLHVDFPPGVQYAVAPVADEPYEVISPEFHPLEQIHDFINEALRFCRVPSEVVIAAAPGVYRQPLSAVYPWLTEGRMLWQVGFLNGTANRQVSDPYAQPLAGHADYGSGELFLAHPGWVFPNPLVCNLGADQTAVATTLTVANGAAGDPAQFPPAPFTVQVGLELERVTAKTTPTSWAVDRHQHGTLAAAHVAATSTVTLTALIFLRGLFPASAFCTSAAGVPQQGLALDADSALPDEQWVTAGALKEAWVSAPDTLENLTAQQHGLSLQQASLAFQRWQETVQRRAGLRRTFADPVALSVGY